MSTKYEDTSKKLLLSDALRHPEETFLTQLKEQKETVIQRQPLISEAGLAKLVSQLTKGPVALKPPVMQLSARQPYDSVNGLVDMYQPGRWDATSDLIYMQPIVHPNPASPGEWTGSAGYITFHPPSSGTYVMMVHFFGYQVTMSLNGPAGTTTASSFSNTPAAVAMLFSGGPTGFSFACTGIYLGFVQSIQAFQV
ncbi:MAG: hypothetical protein JWO80_3790 [Bryobacterales bacterium]|nr:hypothetical protein [Bryobacterales bacterium]